jgi:diketogulonate reductase-like aldo/keto reductase
VVGEALADALRGGLPRERLFVVSKVLPHHASEEGVVAVCERSLRALRLDHIDLYLLHWRGGVPLADTVHVAARALMSKCGSATLLIPLGGRK